MLNQKVFLSYCHSDSEDALDLAARLKKEGVNIRVHRLDTSSPASCGAETANALESCDCLLIVVSRVSDFSNNAWYDLQYAFAEKKPIIAVKINACQVPVYRGLLTIDLSPDYENGILILLNALNLAIYPAAGQGAMDDAGQNVNGMNENRKGIHWELGQLQGPTVQSIIEIEESKGKKNNQFDVFFWLGAIIILFVSLFFLSLEPTSPFPPSLQTSMDLTSIGFTDSTSYYKSGLDYYTTKNFSKAFESFQVSADKGEKEAMTYIGNMYNKGQGVSRNYNKAMEWYKKAIDAGDAHAMNNMGDLFYYGQGATQDYYKAMECYMKAAEAGHAPAMCNVGSLFYYGRGVTQDYNKAMEWYKKSAAADFAQAMNNIGELFQYGQGVGQDYHKAMEWYKKAADAGNALAMENIAALYNGGKGVIQDPNKAKEWHGKAKQVKTDWIIK